MQKLIFLLDASETYCSVSLLLDITFTQYCNKSPVPDADALGQDKSIGQIINLDKFIAIQL